MMIKFSEFLTEAAGKALSASVSNIKTKGHVKRYVLPFLSAKQRAESVKNLSGFFNDKDAAEIGTKNHGEHHNPKTSYTHELSSNHGPHKKGTKVKVKSVFRNGNNIMAKTEFHGDMPISKLGTPANLAAAPKTKEGFELEHILQKNVDPRFKPAGSTGDSWDFVAGNPDDDTSVKGKAVKKDESKPILRGESKASKKGAVAMGTISLNFDPETKKWDYAKGKSKMKNKFEEAVHPTSGLPLVDHLNKYHKNGILDKGFNTEAPAGTTRHYLNGIGANALHLHRYAKDSKGNYTLNHGTTYTIGDDNHFKGHLGLSHLGNKELDSLDGKLHVEPSGQGTVQIKHRPSASIFNSFANKSREDPGNHMDLSREEHGNIFRDRYSKHLNKIRSILKKPSTKSEGPSNEMFGRKFHSDKEI